MNQLVKPRAEPVIATQWNVRAQYSYLCKDDPRVVPATLAEVKELLNTDGHYNKAPYFSYEYLGIIKVNGISQVVSPGNYIMTKLCGNVYIISSTEFNRDYEPYDV